MNGSDLYFQQSPTYQQTAPTPMQRLNAWLWMTALTGTRWMRNPNAPRSTGRQKFMAGLTLWAFIGFFPIVVFLLGVWVVWLFCRLCFLALAVVLTAGLGLRRLAQR